MSGNIDIRLGRAFGGLLSPVEDALSRGSSEGTEGIDAVHVVPSLVQPAYRFCLEPDGEHGDFWCLAAELLLPLRLNCILLACFPVLPAIISVHQRTPASSGACMTSHSPALFPPP